MVSIQTNTLSIAPLQISKTSRAVLASFGATVISTLYGAVSLAINELTKQIVDAGIAALEKQSAVLFVRAQLATLKGFLDQADKMREELAPYIKCLELIPEVRTPVVNVLDIGTDIVNEIRNYANKLERLTYMSDLANALVDQLQKKLENALRLQTMLKNLLDQLPTIPAIEIAIALGTVFTYPCEICPPLDPILKEGKKMLDDLAKQNITISTP